MDTAKTFTRATHRRSKKVDLKSHDSGPKNQEAVWKRVLEGCVARAARARGGSGGRSPARWGMDLDNGLLLGSNEQINYAVIS